MEDRLKAGRRADRQPSSDACMQVGKHAGRHTNTRAHSQGGRQADTHIERQTQKHNNNIT